jgi:predicted nucleic acid-binding protein
MNVIDTNVLLYAFGPEEDQDQRPAKARSPLCAGGVAFSVSVLQGFYVQATHSRRQQPLTLDEAMTVIDSLGAFPIVSNAFHLFRRALRPRERVQISFWDTNILTAVIALECDRIFSEDLNRAPLYGGVRVMSPFMGH